MELNEERNQAKRIALVVSLREAARLLDLSYWCLVGWARQNPPKIRTVLLGRLRKVPMSEIERLARGGGDGQ